ncbi:MAG: hypothetical protein KDD33_01540 [Bdellovibrionales bacterium]|nr:hypothetical protein [Bdellovibrionales bacterium]
MNWISVFAALTILASSLPLAFAEDRKEDTTEYHNTLDDDLTFDKMTFIPTYDNVNGVYSRSVDKKLEELIKKNHHWNYIETHIAGSIVKPEELVLDSQKVMSFAKHLGADGFFTAETRKDPEGLQVSLYLFSSKSGRLVAEQRKVHKEDNTSIVLSSIEQMMSEIKERIPYDALIVSRVDNRVTINAGKRDGVRVGQTLPCIKIISAQRHPKRNFIIKSEKAVLGQIRVVKADSHLSFADILSETEPGVLRKGVKVTGISQIQYGETPWTQTYTPPEQLLSENNKVVFGKKATEWIAKDPPTFGKVGGNFTIGSYSNNLSLSSGTNYTTQVDVYPRLNLHGQLWMTPQWYAEAQYGQGIGTSKNPSGGTPSELSNSMSQYRVSVGYNLILRNEFFGPKFFADIGFANYSMYVDSTAGQGFTSVDYRSVAIGLGGYTPINLAKTWGFGGKIYFHAFPRLNEKPFSSGSSDNNINQFQFFADYKLSQRLRWTFNLDFLLLSSSFKGAGDRTIPANSMSHRHMGLATGVDYLF